MANEEETPRSNLERTRENQTQASVHPRPRTRPQRPQRPHFSLAGSQVAHATSFIDPNYYEHSPDYNLPQEKPVWGLARPLPRVVRSGMRQPTTKNPQAKRTRTFAPAVGDHEHEPNTEATPQVARVATQIADAAGDFDETKRTRPERHERRMPSMKSWLSTQSRKSSQSTTDANTFSRFGSPEEEIGNPMDAWAGQPQQPAQNDGDFRRQALGRLPTVAEVPSTGTGLETPISELEMKETLEVDDEDLEEGLDEDDFVYRNRWSMIRAHLREPMAECLATFVSIVLGLSTDLSVLTSKDKAGTYQSANWAGGLGVMVGIYIAGGISGGHLNPAISLTLCIFRGFPLRKAMIYIPAQIFGAFLGALVAFNIYRDGILQLDGGLLNASRVQSGNAFLTGLQVNFGAGAGFINEFVATGILSGTILALGDDENAPPGAGMHALIVGLVVVVLGMAFAYPTGACINPARDLGPRLAALAVGYGRNVFTGDSLWWIWGGCAATISGALVGGLLYDGFIFVGSESPVNYIGRKKRRKPISKK